MKGSLAFLSIVIGAIVASFGVAQTDPSVDGWVSIYQVNNGMALGGLVLLAIGIAIRRSGAQDAKAAQSDGGNLGKAASALDQLTERTSALTTRLNDFVRIEDVTELRHALAEIVTGPVTAFADNRQAITDTHGIGAYAAVMGPFS